MTGTLLIFGFGFSAEAVWQRVRNSFDHCVTTTRSGDKFESISAAGAEPVIFDGVSADGAMIRAVGEATHILVSIAPNEAGDPVINAFSNEIAAAGNLEWIGYFSTVGVYGDHDGAWVNEETPCQPVSTRSIQRINAETAWQAVAGKTGIPLAIFRLSGIYGPGRNAFVSMERGRSRRLVKPGQVFNRIHREDIAQAVDLAMEVKAAGIFNITDDEPAPPQDLVTFAHELAGREPPSEIDFESADLSPMARSFYGENKRVCNDKSKRVLGMRYAYPDYRTALAAMWCDGSWKG